jgi:hypothetical protein
MQHAVFLFGQIFFVILAVSVVGIVIFTVIKNRKNDDFIIKDNPKKNLDKKKETSTDNL